MTTNNPYTNYSPGGVIPGTITFTVDSGHGADPEVVVEAARRPKGQLEKQVREVCDRIVTGELDFEGKPTTAHRVARVIAHEDPDYGAPSAGSIAAVFKRWESIGAAVLDEKPAQFIGYTLEASEIGFKELYERASV
jgi:hypothetical protein